MVSSKAATAREIAAFYNAPDWYSLDHANNRILACSPGAWRNIGWIVPGDHGFPLRLPAETYGPLPVVGE